MDAPRQHPRQPGRLLGAVSVVLATPLFALIIGAVIFAAVEVIAAVLTTGGTMRASRSFFVAGGNAPLQVNWWLHLLSLLACAACVVACAGLGRRLGARLPLPVSRSGGVGNAGLPVLAPLLAAGGGALLWVAADGALRVRTVAGTSGPDLVVGGIVWVLLATAVTLWLLRRPASSTRLAVAVLAPAAAATTAAGLRPAAEVGLGLATAPAWFPLSLLSPDGWVAADQPMPTLVALTSQLFDLSLLFLLSAAWVLAFSAGTAASTRQVGPVAVDPAGAAQT